MPMIEIKLNQLLHKNPQILIYLNSFITFAFIEEYAEIPYSEKYLSQYGRLTPIQVKNNIDMDFEQVFWKNDNVL